MNLTTEEKEMKTPNVILGETWRKTKELTERDRRGELWRQKTSIEDQSSSHRPPYYPRAPQHAPEPSHPLYLPSQTYHLRPSPRSRSVDKRCQGKRYDKTLASLELGLHLWQDSPLETTIKTRLREEKLGKVHMKPVKELPVVIKEDDRTGLVSEVLKTVATPEAVVLTRDQKMRLSGELLGKRSHLSHRPATRGISTSATYRSSDTPKSRTGKQLIC